MPTTIPYPFRVLICRVVSVVVVDKEERNGRMSFCLYMLDILFKIYMNYKD